MRGGIPSFERAAFVRGIYIGAVSERWAASYAQGTYLVRLG